jgi:hypothetical protein
MRHHSMRSAASMLPPRPPVARRRHRARIAALVCAALSVLAACAKKDFKSELDRVESWTATSRLAADRRLNGATNAAITSQLVDRAIAARVEAERSFATLASSDSERAAARVALDSLRRGIVQLERVNR